MFNKSDSAMSETGNWNVAGDYAREKIMKPLVMVDIYENLALFGYDDILEELMNYDKIPNYFIRITGLKRLIRELLKIAKNSKFALKKKGTKEDMEKIEKRLVKVESIIPLLYDERFSEVKRTRQVTINEGIFTQVLDLVLKIKSEINDPLNQNNLIFIDKDEFDPEKVKKQMMDDLANKG